MERFTLRKLDKGIIQGVHWPVEDPEKVVCIIHGIGEYAERYDRIAGMLNAAGFAVFSMDLRGHGDSIGKKGDCSPRSELLEDVSALISHASRTCPDRKIIIYGHSLGGNITLDYRRRGAFRDLPAGYIVSSPWVRLVRPIPLPFYHLAKMLARIAPTMVMGSNVKEKDLGNPENILPYHDDPKIHNRISMRGAVEGFMIGREMEMDSGARTDEKTKTIPMLMMHGGEDMICHIDGTRAVYGDLRSAGENVSFREFPELYHEIHNGGAESDGSEVIEMVVEFIRGC